MTARSHKFKITGRRTRAQAMVEFALVLPVALLLVALAATGGQMLVADINITQAARAGATAAEYQYNNGNTIGGSAPATLPCSAGNPPSPEVCWATTAAEQELGSPLQCTAGGSVPTGCLTVSQFPDPTYNSGEELVQVAVWDSITPYLPLFPRVTIKAVATAEQ